MASTGSFVPDTHFFVLFLLIFVSVSWPAAEIVLQAEFSCFLVRKKCNQNILLCDLTIWITPITQPRMIVLHVLYVYVSRMCNFADCEHTHTHAHTQDNLRTEAMNIILERFGFVRRKVLKIPTEVFADAKWDRAKWKLSRLVDVKSHRWCQGTIFQLDKTCFLFGNSCKFSRNVNTKKCAKCKTRVFLPHIFRTPLLCASIGKCTTCTKANEQYLAKRFFLFDV